MAHRPNQEFQKLLGLCAQLASEYPDGLVYIGGIAVYLHATNSTAASQYAEATHDADFYISAADMSDLREREEVQANRRLSRHQIVRGGFEFDIYTQYHSALRVPYDEVMAHCASYDGVRVASLEHLLVMKLDAYSARRASAHGRKDARDLLRIAMMASVSAFVGERAAAFLDDAGLFLLGEIAKGPEPTVLAAGNAQVAKAIRQTYSRMLTRLR